MTPVNLAEVARQQNDRDFAAGRMPSRYIEDTALLVRVARLMAEHQAEEGGDRARSA